MANNLAAAALAKRQAQGKGITPEQAAIIVKASQTDPLFFPNTILGANLWDKQIDVVRSVWKNRRTTVRACHGVGKTRVAAVIALSFLYSYPGSQVVTTAPTWPQVENLLWREIAQVHAQARVPLGGKPLSTELELSKALKWYAIGLSTNKPERFQGFHAENILLIVDEASGVDQSIFDAAEGFLTTPGARLLLIGNPTRLSGEFYTSFRSPIYSKIHISAFDSPNWKAQKILRPYLVTPEWIEEKRIQWGENSPLWYSRVRGDFPIQGDDVLIHLSAIEMAQRLILPEGDPNELGVDVARFGSDNSVIAHRRGGRVRITDRIHGHDTMEVAGYVARRMDDTGATIAKIDTIGVGAGVYDRLKELGKPVAGMNASEGAIDKERYANKRAEWYCEFRDRLNAGEVDLDPYDDALAGQLAAIKFKFTSRGQYLLQAKEEMKKKGLGSPDDADAVVLAYATPETDPEPWAGYVDY